MTSVTIVVPAYNEGAAFAAALSSLSNYLAVHTGAGYEFQYLIVDDGSSDETYPVAQEFARWRPGVKVLRHDRNRGLGAALRTAFKAVDSEIAVVLDADLSYAPPTAMALIEALERENADVALASAYAPGGSVVNVPLARRILSREANRLLSLATGGRYATLTCMVRAYRVTALRRLRSNDDRMTATVELVLSALRANLHVIEVPATLSWSDDRRRTRHGIAPARTAWQIYATVMMACRYRPSLWLALPGLVPGLLPLVVALLLAFHVSKTALALGTGATIVVQYASLALFSGQIAAFVRRRFQHKRRTHTNGVTNNGFDLPSHTA